MKKSKKHILIEINPRKKINFDRFDVFRFEHQCSFKKNISCIYGLITFPCFKICPEIGLKMIFFFCLFSQRENIITHGASEASGVRNFWHLSAKI